MSAVNAALQERLKKNQKLAGISHSFGGRIFSRFFFDIPDIVVRFLKVIVYFHPISLYKYSLNLNSVYNGIDHT